MYGKFFASTFTGSMMGAGPHVFAVWGYVIANTVNGQIELNPKLVATVIGCSSDDVKSAIDFLCSPDPESRSKEHEGKRMIREGQFAFKVVNHDKYKAIRNEDDRREYNRIKQQESRARKASAVKSVNDGQLQSTASAHTEAEAESEGSLCLQDQDPSPSQQSGSRARDPGATEHVPPATACHHKPYDAFTIGNAFGRIRSQVLGGVHHNGPGGPVAPAKLADAAAYVNDQPGGPDSVEGSMRVFWESVRSGQHSDAQLCAKNAAFAFGSWFTGTFQAFHDGRMGTAPKNVPAVSKRTPRDGGLAAFLAAGEKVPA